MNRSDCRLTDPDRTSIVSIKQDRVCYAAGMNDLNMLSAEDVGVLNRTHSA